MIRQAGIAALVFILLIGGGFMGLLLSRPPISADASGSGCSAPGVSVDTSSLPDSIGVWSKAQLAIAAVVINTVSQRGGDRWLQQTTLATAMKESSLQNIAHGDAVRNDTIGVFQIGPEHGAYEDRMNPAWATGNFLDRLFKVPDYRSLTPTLAAHKAQRNKDPNAYASMWDDAGAVIDGLGAVRTLSSVQTARTYQLGAVKPATQQVANSVGTQFGITTAYGYRAPASEKWDPAGHPAGLAIDFMINDIPDGKSVGDRLASFLITNAQAIGVKYIIWQQRSWTPERGEWKQMEDRGSPTQNHLDHVHLSLDESATGTVPQGDATACAASSEGDQGTSTPVTSGWAQPILVKPGTRSFGPRMHPVHHVMKMHEGQDFGASCGTPIYAANAGTVTFAGQRGGYGHLIILDHGGGVTTRYGHMYANGLKVSVGQKVTAGQRIADVGSDGTSTACHLHFEVRTAGTAIDPIAFLAGRGVTW